MFNIINTHLEQIFPTSNNVTEYIWLSLYYDGTFDFHKIEWLAKILRRLNILSFKPVEFVAFALLNADRQTEEPNGECSCYLLI